MARPPRGRELPEWTPYELHALGRSYTARVDRSLELLEFIAAELGQKSGSAARTPPKGTVKLRERRR